MHWEYSSLSCSWEKPSQKMRCSILFSTRPVRSLGFIYSCCFSSEGNHQHQPSKYPSMQLFQSSQKGKIFRISQASSPEQKLSHAYGVSRSRLGSCLSLLCNHWLGGWRLWLRQQRGGDGCPVVECLWNLRLHLCRSLHWKNKALQADSNRMPTAWNRQSLCFLHMPWIFNSASSTLRFVSIGGAVPLPIRHDCCGIRNRNCLPNRLSHFRRHVVICWTATWFYTGTVNAVLDRWKNEDVLKDRRWNIFDSHAMWSFGNVLGQRRSQKKC